MAIKIFLYLFAVTSIVSGYAFPKGRDGPVAIQQGLAKRQFTSFSYGPYQLLNFDSPSITLMRSIFDALGRALVTVNHDLAQTSTDGQRTPNPSAAFLAFFNSAGSVPYVASVFNNATAGVSLLDPTPYSATGAPTFFSVTARGQMSANVNNQMVDAWDNCNSNSALTAFYLNVETYPVPYIALCPLFFTAQPPVIFGDTPPASVSGQPASNCLRINTSINRFQYTGSGNTKPLTQYRTWILLEEIVHYYTSITLGVTSDVSDANKAFRLSTGASLPNAPSYLYYAASIVGNCNSFPIRHRGQELLELSDPVDPNDYGLNVTSPAPAWNVMNVSLETNSTIA